MCVTAEYKAILFRQNLLAGRLEKAENGYLISLRCLQFIQEPRIFGFFENGLII